MELVSVIVPLFNSAKYMEKCINSILKQTYYNIELILIDDGSSDETVSICKKFCTLDKRTILIEHSSNLGASAARNTGLNLAKGKFIMFVDSDNYIEPKMIEDCINLQAKKKADIICCATYVNENKPKIYPNAEYKDKQALYAMINIIGWSVCAKLYKASLLKNIRFKENLLTGEDLFFSWQIFSQENIIIYYIDTPYYHIINRKNSLGMRRTVKNYYSFYWVSRYICKQSRKYQYNSIYKIFILKTVGTSISLSRLIIENKAIKYYRFLNIIQKFLRRNMDFLFKRNISIKMRMGMLLLIMPLKIAIPIIKLIKK